jgi:folate-dependent phosphoribosylglycinamide formyltransferase PurN
MRIVILGSSVYSETACAVAVRMAELGYVPVGALALRTLDSATVLRKIRQWGMRRVAGYARAKLIPPHGGENAQVRNPHLEPLLKYEKGTFRSLSEVAAYYRFPVVICKDQNTPDSIARLKDWAPDLIIFTGGNILRKQLLEVPRLGVVNVHLGLLPEIRGMSSPEWSLLTHVPIGITIHYVDASIDTGPVLQRREFPGAAQCESMSDLRDRLIAFGVENVADVVGGLDRGAISATPQSDPGRDNQYFVMHEWLQARAAERLAKSRPAAVAGTVNG